MVMTMTMMIIITMMTMMTTMMMMMHIALGVSSARSSLRRGHAGLAHILCRLFIAAGLERWFQSLSTLHVFDVVVQVLVLGGRHKRGLGS
eukprot:12408362-Karenia_brevis.AAC.1